MKKIAFCLLATCLSLTFIPLQSNAATSKPSSSLVATKPADPAESPEANALLKRLDKINSLDKTKLSSTDKKNLRKEVRSIKHNLKEISGGIYVSVGVILLVAVLLIVLL